MCASSFVDLAPLNSGNEIGPFRAIEESVVAHLTASASRSDVYAWYNLIATAGAAFGMMTCGWTVHHFAEDLDWHIVDAYRSVFVAYAALGVVKLLLVLLLSREVEAEKKPEQQQLPPDSETTPLLGDVVVPGAATKPPREKKRWGIMALLPEISQESRGIMVSLCLLFALDSFASGLAPLYVIHHP